MIAYVCKNLNNLNSKQSVCRFLPVSLRFFSTSREIELGINPKFSDVLAHKYNFPPELASRIASDLDVETAKRANSTLLFLKENGFSNAQLVKIIKDRPRLLSVSLEDKIIPRFKFLQDEGFSPAGICKMLTSNPSILFLKLETNIIPSLYLLKGLLESDDQVAIVGKKAPWFLTANLQKSMLPNVELLKSCGISMDRIRIILLAQPRCFLIKPEIMRRCVEKAEEMGLDATSKSFIYAIPAIAHLSRDSWELKLKGFRKLGFSDSDVMTMFCKEPRVFNLSTEKIEKVKKLLLATGRFNLSTLVNWPLAFMFSIEKRYTPRLKVLGILENKKLIKEWPSLASWMTMSDKAFFQKYVSPHLHHKAFSQWQKCDGI